MALALFKPSRVTKSHGPAFRVGWFVGRLIVWFLVLSVGLTLVYRFVPVPVTITTVRGPPRRGDSLRRRFSVRCPKFTHDERRSSPSRRFDFAEIMANRRRRTRILI